MSSNLSSGLSSLQPAPAKINGAFVREVPLAGLPRGHHVMPTHVPGGFVGYILTTEGWRGYGLISTEPAGIG